jgi:2-epi-valiolone-7-phosphate 1-reductase
MRRLLASPAAQARVVRGAARAPAAEEIELRVVRVGLCGTDVQIATGLRTDVAAILGHEGLALVVDERGPPVVFNPVHPDDQDSILGHSYDGLFQDRIVVRRPEHGGPELCCASPRLLADLAPLVEPLGTVLYSFELLDVEAPPSSLAIFGAGATATLHALLAARRGVQTHLVHRRSKRLSWLADEGLSGGASLHVTGPCLRARTRTAGGLVDAAVLCVPRDAAPRALEDALAFVRDGGVVNLFGGFRPGDRHPLLPGVDLGEVRRSNVRGSQPANHLVVRTATGASVRLTGQRGTSSAHLAEAQRLLMETPATFARAVSRVVSLEGLADVLRSIGTQAAGERPERCKVIADLTLQAGEERNVDLVRTVADVA